MEDDTQKSSLRRTLCQYSCFRHNTHEALRSHDDSPKVKSPEIRYKCRHLIGRIGRQNWWYSSPDDFRYDPISYAMNFDDGFVDEAQSRNSRSRVLATRTVPADEGSPVKQSVSRAIHCA